MSMIDPRKTPVFDADIYSARYPDVSYKGDAKKIKQFQEAHKDYLARTNSYMGDLDDEIRRRGLDAFFGARKIAALQLAFLEQVKGQKLDAEVKPKPRQYEWVDTPAIKQFFATNGVKHTSSKDEYYRKLSDVVREGIAEFYNTKGELDAIDKQGVIDDYIQMLFNPDTGLLHFSNFDRILRESQSVGQSEPDYYDFEQRLREAIRPYEDEFREWVLTRIQGAEGQRYLTSEGGRKMPYNPDNVLKLMTKKLKGAGNFNYGLGSVRAIGATRFKNFDDMNATAHRIVPHEVFQGIKEEQNTAFFKLVEELSPYHPVGNSSFRSSDALQSALAESFKPGRSLARELQKDGYQGLPPELVSKVNQFRSELKRAPTEYFEAKPQRIIRLDEFVGAVVPDNTTPAVLAALRENRLPIATYTSGGSRQAAIAQLVSQVLSTSRTASKLPLGKVAQNTPEKADDALAQPNWVWDSPPEVLEQFPALKTYQPNPEFKYSEQLGKKFWVWRAPRGFGFSYPGLGSLGTVLAEVNLTNGTLKLSRRNALAHPDTADMLLLLAKESDLAELKVIGVDERDGIDGSQTIRELAALVQEQKHEAPLYGREVEGAQYSAYRYRVIKSLADHEWYHVTRASLLPSIMKRGLLPSREARQEGVEGWSPPTNLGLQNAIYLTALQDYAERIAETLAGRFMEDIVILKISCPLDPRTLTVDEDALRNDFDSSIGGHDSRYPAFIESVSDSIQSVGVKAVIPANCIEEIARLSAPVYVKDEFKNDSYYLDGGLEWTYPEESTSVEKSGSLRTRLSLG